MGNDNGRRPVRQDSPLREWVSDNLRYLILIGIIAAAVIAVVLIVGALSGNEAGQETAEVSEETITPEVTVTEEPAVTKEPAVTETPAPTPSPTPVEKKPEPTKAPEKEKDGLVPAEKTVKSIINDYFSALMAADPDAVSAVTESITDQDITAITNGVYMRDYSDIEVWTYPGDGKNEYVALVSYTYSYPGYQTRIPALTALYIIEGSDGRLCIASENTEDKKSVVINKALTDEKSLELRDKISKLYDEALASDPELGAYISSLNG